MNYLYIIRPINLIIIVITQLLFREFVIKNIYGLFDLPPALGLLDFSLLIFASVFIAAAGYVINDMEDIKVDQINKPGRNFVAEKIDSGKAMVFFFVLNTSGLLAGFILAYRLNYLSLGFIFIAIALLLWLYSTNYKRRMLIGNLSIALLSAMVIITLWLMEFFALRSKPILFSDLSKPFQMVTYFALGYASFAFLISLVREIVKDMEDYEGDKEENYNTLPIAIGINRSRIFISIIILLSMILLGYGQYELLHKGFKLVTYYLIIVQILFLYLLVLIYQAKTKKHFYYLSQLCKVIMVIGIISVILI